MGHMFLSINRKPGTRGAANDFMGPSREVGALGKYHADPSDTSKRLGELPD